MEPRITGEMQIFLAGMSFYGDHFDTHGSWDEDNQIGQLWKRFMSFLEKNQESIRKFSNTERWFELHLYDEQTDHRGLFEVFVGAEVSFDPPESPGNVPHELQLKILPVTQYAVFTFSGENITRDMDKTMQDWISGSDFTNRYTYSFQVYDERFKGMDKLEESVLDVYVPVTKTD